MTTIIKDENVEVTTLDQMLAVKELEECLLKEYINLLDIEKISQEIVKVKKEMNRLDELYADLQKKMLLVMERDDIGSYENKDVEITSVGETVAKRFDTTKFKEKYPEVYRHFSVDSPRKAYLRVKLIEKDLY